MTHDDRIRVAAAIAPLAALVGALWALRQGFAVEPIGWTAALAYGAVLALLTAALDAPLGAVAVTSLKYTALTVAYSVWLAVAALYAVWQLARGRGAPKGVFV